MSIIGRKFPSLWVKSVDAKGTIVKKNLYQLAVDEKKKVLLFWYPKDFTFVCPTEIHAFQDTLSEFEQRNTIVIGASCDTAEVHMAWLNTPKNKGGIQGVTFPLLADSTHLLATKLDILDGCPCDNYDDDDDDYDYDMSSEERSKNSQFDSVTYRATYLIDEQGVLFHVSINHMPLGRNVDEFLRLIDAYTHVQEHGEVCPANWHKGQQAMKANSQSTAEYLSSH